MDPLRQPPRGEFSQFHLARAGEKDRNKMLKELGVRINTIYNVTTELARNGYVLAIHRKKVPPPYSLSSSPTYSPPLTFPPSTQNPPPVSSEVNHPGGFTPVSTQIITPWGVHSSTWVVT